MPSIEELGEIGIVRCGGGCMGLIQAVQLREFYKAGIIPKQSWNVSVGAFNSLTSDVIEIWQKHITSPFAIYDMNPALKKVFKDARQFIAPFKRHDSWKEWMRDFKSQKQNAWQFLMFCKRTISTALKIAQDFPNGDFANSKNFSSIAEFAVSALKEHELYNLQSILDIGPLMKIVEENIDLEKALKGPPLNILVRNLRTGKERVIAPKSAPELLQTLRAASALVPFFEPVKIGNEFFCDVGAVNPFPVEYAFDAGCDTVFAFTKGRKGRVTKPQNVIEAWFLEVDIHTKRIFTLLFGEAKKRAKQEGKKLYLVTPQHPIHPDLGFLSISPDAIEYTIEKEGEATKKFLEKILK